MEEIWKDVKGYEGLYQVSSLGRIKSLERLIISGRNNKVKRYIADSIRNLVLHKKTGYHSVAFSRNGTMVRFTIHRVVATAFLENKENKPCVNHKNGIKTDNRVENLEWVTYQENTIHAFDTKLKIGSMTGRFGENHNRHKLYIPKK